MSDTFGQDWIGARHGLPDPDADPQFYEGVPARRLLAAFIDFVALWGAAFLFLIGTLGIGFFVLGLFLLVADFAHRVIMISAGSATIGMRLARIELRRRDGRRFDMAHAIGHTLLFYLASVSVIAQLISVIMMMGSPLGRGLHDLPFGSTMISSPG